MDKALFDRIVQALSPDMSDERTRKPRIEAALYGAPVLAKIDWTGPQDVFTYHLVQTLDRFGDLQSGTPALAVLLSAWKAHVGIDRQAAFDEVIRQLTPPASPPPPAAPGTLHTFISYSRKDTPFVEQLEAALHARGITTWRDAHSIPGGDDWYQNIVTGLANAYAVLCIVTPNADESRWVRREQLRADEDGIPSIAIHPAKYRNPFHLQEVQPILMDDANFAAGLEQVIAALDRCKTKTRSAPPVTVSSAFTRPDDDAAVAEYLKWVLSDAKADLRDALYVDLAASPERAPQMRAKSVLSDDLVRDDEFVFSSIGLEHLAHEDFAKSGEEVPDARQAIRDLRRAVLLGDPGAGKTTTLLKIAVDLARAAQGDKAARLPVFVPLREFDGSTSFEAFVRGKTHNLQAAFDRLRDRFVLLCDALNEMPRKGKDDGRDLVAEVRDTLSGRADWVVSCRVRDYTDDLSGIDGIGKIRLKPLDPPRIQEFITRKFADLPVRGAALWSALGGSDLLLKAWEAFVRHGAPEGFWGKEWLPEKPYWWEDEGRAWQTMHADHRRLMLLCRSPFMANMVSALYRRSERLPENRAGLFRDFVANLLNAEKKRLTDIGLTWIGDEPIRAGMGQIAWAMGAQTEMPRADAEAILKDQGHDPAKLLSAAASAQIIDYGVNVRFTHQLLQQYFAAAVLGAMMDKGGDPAVNWKPDAWWESTGREETAILLAGDRNDPHGAARWIAPAQPHLALELLSQPDFALDLEKLDTDTRTALITGAHGKTSTANPVGRAAAYRVLGKFDADTRKGIGVIVRDGMTLPDIDWVIIPGGEYIYQKDQRITLPTFQISRYLITYKQFQAFIDAPDGWKNPQWWKGLSADDNHKAQPGDQVFKFWNHPCERVSWYDAVAFCRWLSAKLGYIVTLPTEQQYERTARWTDGRLYPWGNDYIIGNANINEAYGNAGTYYLQQTSAVGIYPQGASVEDVHDLSGNVWEWCLNEYKKPENTQDSSNNSRVVRGGSWDDYRGSARAVVRLGRYPDNRDDVQGFRLARS